MTYVGGKRKYCNKMWRCFYSFCVCGCRSKQPKKKREARQSTFSYLILFSSGTRLIAAEQYTVAHLLVFWWPQSCDAVFHWRTDESVITKEKNSPLSLSSRVFLSHPSLGLPQSFFFFAVLVICVYFIWALFFNPFVSFFRDIGNKSYNSFWFFDRRTAPQGTTQSAIQTTGMMEQAQVQ